MWGGGNVQQSLPHCLLDPPVPSVSCDIDKCLGVLWNEVWAHCFISVNIYRAAVSRVYFQSALAYKDREILIRHGIKLPWDFLSVKTYLPSDPLVIIGNVGLTCKQKVEAQTA